MTALHWACSKGHVDAVKLLIEFHAFPNHVEFTEDRYTPLDYALMGEHDAVAQYVIEQGGLSITGIEHIAAGKIQVRESRAASVEFNLWVPIHRPTNREGGLDRKQSTSLVPGDRPMRIAQSVVMDQQGSKVQQHFTGSLFLLVRLARKSNGTVYSPERRK